MYGVTNRQVRPNSQGVDKLGPKPNAQGPNELRLFEALVAGSGWDLEIIADRLTAAMKAEVDAPANRTAFGSYYVARKVLCQARDEKRNVLFFVHGFNNDIHDVLRRSQELEKNYGVIVLPFSWPANGGGIVSGTASYKSDKRDARVSAGALDRTMAIAAGYLARFTEETRLELANRAREKHPDNAEARDALFTELMDKACPFTINAMFHSMGNYVLKQMLKSSNIEGNQLLFDNIVLAAADTNNAGHAEWVDRLKFRRRLYVAINEDDRALAASRIKAGDEQLARLGHSLFALDSRKATYVNFTSAAWVGNAHAYFEDKPVEKNDDVRKFFQAAFNGKTAEQSLRYIPDRNFYEFR
ncbi:alpha/beta hydrolase [Salinisphaera aquimarina]|uniref:Alpha/beta hydrolase n=1 Tax=Salinisphaera aquimarina TaxID=2094031 RepID=A0ABV7ES46_9GAMM